MAISAVLQGEGLREALGEGHDQPGVGGMAGDLEIRVQLPAETGWIQGGSPFEPWLARAHVLVDLGAAPGGWCQVAKPLVGDQVFPVTVKSLVFH